jgi:outer membrane protein insertion porin family
MIRFLLPFLLFTTLLSAVKVERIDFTGNRIFPDRELVSVITSRAGEEFDASRARRDSEALANHYAKRGYRFVEVDYPQFEIGHNGQGILTFSIREYREMVVDSLRITGPVYFTEPRLREIVGAQTPLSLDGVATLMRDIVDVYAARGFLFASTTLDTIRMDENGLFAVIGVHEGELCKAQTFRFSGNTVTKPNTLLRIARVNTGIPFTLPILTKIEDRISKKDYIKSCSVSPLDSRTVLIDVLEGRMTRLSGLAAYDNSRNERKLTGWVDLDFLNLFGTDRSLGVYWQRLTAYRSLLKLDYHESGPFTFPVAGDLGLSREEVDSTYIESIVSLDVYYETMYQKFGLTLAVDDIYPGSRRPILYDTDLRRQVGMFYTLDTVDFWANPSQGNLLAIRWTEVFRTNEGKREHEPVTEVDATHFAPLGHSYVLMAAVHGKNRPQRELADYDLFELGGANNLRGFPENAFSGFRIGWSNLELRYLLSRTSRMLAFLDYGYVEYTESGTVKRIDNLFGYGFGLAVQTKVGVFKLNYALSYDQGEWRQPLDGIVHFGFETQL